MMTFPALYSLYGNADGSHSCKEIHFYLFNVFSLLHACCTEVLLNYCLFVLSVSVCHVLMFLLLLWALPVAALAPQGKQVIARLPRS